MNKYEFVKSKMIYIADEVTESCRRSGDDDIGRKMSALTRVLLDIMYDEMHKPAELKIKRTEDAKQFPLIHAGKNGDVGFDLPAVFPENTWGERESITINPGERGVIPTGISLELPEGRWASIEARSSTSKSMLMVPKGVIDEGYRGELFAVLLNVGHAPVVIYHGDRYVQLIVHKRENANINIVEVDELSESERGDTGFGSTGRSAVKG